MPKLNFKFGNKTFHSIEDFIEHADLTGWEALDQKTGEVMNSYEFFWKLFQRVLKEAHDE